MHPANTKPRGRRCSAIRQKAPLRVFRCAHTVDMRKQLTMVLCLLLHVSISAMAQRICDAWHCSVPGKLCLHTPSLPCRRPPSPQPPSPPPLPLGGQPWWSNITTTNRCVGGGGAVHEPQATPAGQLGQTSCTPPAVQCTAMSYTSHATGASRRGCQRTAQGFRPAHVGGPPPPPLKHES